jgi:hypothetical protein
MIPQNKNLRQLVWHLLYTNTAVDGSELYFYNTEGDINSVVSQASCKMGWTLLEFQIETGMENGPSIRF